MQRQLLAIMSDRRILLLAIWLCLASCAFAQGPELFPAPPTSPPTEPSPFIPPGVAESELFESNSQQQIRELLKRIEKLENTEEKLAKKAAEKKAADSKKPSFKFGQEIQLDSYAFSQDANSKAAYGDIENGTAFRRARIALSGEYGPSVYKLEVDFAKSGRPTFLDVYGGFQDIPYIGRIRAGHFFEPFLLDRQTSNRYQTFMERDLTDQAFAPGRNTGVAINNTYDNERGTITYGVFRADTDHYGDSTGDSFAQTFDGRITYLPYYDERSNGRYLWHIGFAYSARGTNNTRVRFHAQPEARLGAALNNVPYFVDTGIIPSNFYQLIGFETAWVRGPLSVQGEFVLTPVNVKNSGTAYLNGFYLFTSYFLTGESRPYRRGSGTFGRVHPNRDVFRYFGRPENKNVGLGPGAWEIAGRVSFLDFNSGSIHGGQLTDLTIGLNWYLTPYTRITSNYVHAFGQSATGIHSNTDIFGSRFQYDF